MVVERFPPDLGGVARSAARIANALAETGAEVHVLALTRTLPPGMVETGAMQGQSGVTVHRLGLFGNLDFSLQHALNVLEWLHQQHPFDLVWGHYLYPAGYLAVWFAGWSEIPATVSARGNDLDRLMFPPGDFARLMWTIERAALVTSVSADLARKIQILLGRPLPVEVIGNVVDPQVFTPGKAEGELRASLGIQPEEAVLGFCGELRQKKGLPFLLQALSHVRQHRPACLLVIGDVRPREQSFLSTFALEDAESASRILITGEMHDPAEVARRLRLCDVFLLPSLWDGLPNALLEAMACELPVLASDAGGIPEVLQHGRNGFLLPRGQLHRLGESTLEVLSLSAEQRGELGQAARQTILQRYHPAVEQKVLADVLRRLQPNTSS